MVKTKEDFTEKEINDNGYRFCHLCDSLEENKYCTNTSCYEYTRYENN